MLVTWGRTLSKGANRRSKTGYFLAQLASLCKVSLEIQDKGLAEITHMLQNKKGCLRNWSQTALLGTPPP